jgi:hypothetical protein
MVVGPAGEALVGAVVVEVITNCWCAVVVAGVVVARTMFCGAAAVPAGAGAEVAVVLDAGAAVVGFAAGFAAATFAASRAVVSPVKTAPIRVIALPITSMLFAVFSIPLATLVISTFVKFSYHLDFVVASALAGGAVGWAFVAELAGAGATGFVAVVCAATAAVGVGLVDFAALVDAATVVAAGFAGAAVEVVIVLECADAWTAGVVVGTVAGFARAAALAVAAFASAGVWVAALETGPVVLIGVSTLAGVGFGVAVLFGKVAGLPLAGAAAGAAFAGADFAVSAGVSMPLFNSTVFVAATVVVVGATGGAGLIGRLTVMIFPSRLIFTSLNPGGQTSLGTGALVTVMEASLPCSIAEVVAEGTAITDMMCRAETMYFAKNNESRVMKDTNVKLWGRWEEKDRRKVGVQYDLHTTRTQLLEP